MIKNREVADIIKECVLKGGMTRPGFFVFLPKGVEITEMNF